MGVNLIPFFAVLFFPPFLLSSFLRSKSPLILELHKWDLQNRLTPFISSLCHYTRLGFEACALFFPLPTVCARIRRGGTANGRRSDLRFQG